MKAQILVVVAFTALLMSCGGSDFSESTIDQPDVTTDSGLPDSNEEADTNGPDTTADAGPDTTVDASPDVVNDAAPDTTTPVDSGLCTAGAVDCQGKTPRTCNQNGVWQNEKACQYICSNGSCKGSCEPGTKRCNGKGTVAPEVQLCDVNGDWKHSESCVVDCDNSVSPPACTGKMCCSESAGGCACRAEEYKCPTDFVNTCANQYNCCGLAANKKCKCMTVPSNKVSECLNILTENDSAHDVFTLVTSCPVQ